MTKHQHVCMYSPHTSESHHTSLSTLQPIVTDCAAGLLLGHSRLRSASRLLGTPLAFRFLNMATDSEELGEDYPCLPLEGAGSLSLETLKAIFLIFGQKLMR